MTGVAEPDQFYAVKVLCKKCDAALAATVPAPVSPSQLFKPN
jgi:hypothetical protein